MAAVWAVASARGSKQRRIAYNERMPAADAQHIRAFLDMLAAERGAARNTLEAYTRDLADFTTFLA